jgi:hypothetical protein|tara:strand:- start:713 stop:907 length:195 start_codon:yes stop_codon:yes gene_type:complete
MAKTNGDTALVSTGGGSNSLRTTVPMWLVEQFSLEAGDRLSWRLDTDGSSMYIKVLPVKEGGQA